MTRPARSTGPATNMVRRQTCCGPGATVMSWLISASMPITPNGGSGCVGTTLGGPGPSRATASERRDPFPTSRPDGAWAVDRKVANPMPSRRLARRLPPSRWHSLRVTGNLILLRDTSLASSAMPIRDEDEVGEVLNITLEELRTAEEKIRTQNEQLAAAYDVIAAERQRYQELFHFAPDGYLVTDEHG